MHFFFLTLAVVLNRQKVLSSLPLPLDPCQDTLLIPLQNIEACLKGFEHARVFILDPSGEDQRLKAARLATTSFILAIAIVGPINTHVIVTTSILFPPMIPTKPFFTFLYIELLVVIFKNLAVIGGLVLIAIIFGFLVKDYFRFIFLHAFIGA